MEAESDPCSWVSGENISGTESSQYKSPGVGTWPGVQSTGEEVQAVNPDPILGLGSWREVGVLLIMAGKPAMGVSRMQGNDFCFSQPGPGSRQGERGRIELRLSQRAEPIVGSLQQSRMGSGSF